MKELKAETARIMASISAQTTQKNRYYISKLLKRLQKELFMLYSVMNSVVNKDVLKEQK